MKTQSDFINRKSASLEWFRSQVLHTNNTTLKNTFICIFVLYSFPPFPHRHNGLRYVQKPQHSVINSKRQPPANTVWSGERGHYNRETRTLLHVFQGLTRKREVASFIYRKRQMTKKEKPNETMQHILNKPHRLIQIFFPPEMKTNLRSFHIFNCTSS